MNGVGCDSFVGKLNMERSQIVNLDRTMCLNKAIILHTLLHALGFDHEHNRPDRDDWVEFNFKNIGLAGSDSDFRKVDPEKYVDLGTPYDYQSIMHYHSYAFAINQSLPTMKALKAPFEIKINENLSDIDIQEIRTLYSCKPGI